MLIVDTCTANLPIGTQNWPSSYIFVIETSVVPDYELPDLADEVEITTEPG